jgi:hypothetical protein
MASQEGSKFHGRPEHAMLLYTIFLAIAGRLEDRDSFD